eukprot:scaffold10625_cov79-Isochrysis_galbana.AAC.1
MILNSVRRGVGGVGERDEDRAAPDHHARTKEGGAHAPIRRGGGGATATGALVAWCRLAAAGRRCEDGRGVATPPAGAPAASDCAVETPAPFFGGGGGSRQAPPHAAGRACGVSGVCTVGSDTILK